ncbi:MAG: ester cyclase [Aurantibacter sp.]
MKKSLFFCLILCGSVNALGQVDSLLVSDQIESNKQIALKFYNDLWATNNTDKYAETVSDSYVVHDIGERKNVTEPAIQQKKIADFFWDNGDLEFILDYQIAERDLVMTRWSAAYTPQTLFGKFFIGKGHIPIINVVRIKNGKIVEFWNHRHDIDTPQTMKFTLKGLLIGLLIALIPTFFAFRLRRKLKRLKSQ